MSPIAATFSRLGISQAADLFGLSVRALRFYEEAGLIEAGRDRHNHRYYGPEARRRLAWIVELRAAGLGLREIDDLFRQAEEGEPIATLAWRKLEVRRARLQTALSATNELIARLSQDARDGGRIDLARPGAKVGTGPGVAPPARQA